jgi:cytosine/adenosine deaminase-related metal-dependent hydrolase
MTLKIFAKQVLTSSGWQQDISLTVDDTGRISDISKSTGGAEKTVGILLPALSNLHSHSFQRAMAGLAEQRGATSLDDFWTWRKVMYRFLEILSPDDIEAIAALVQMEMLESGYAASAEFHYLHHDHKGVGYSSPTELSDRQYRELVIPTCQCYTCEAAYRTNHCRQDSVVLVAILINFRLCMHRSASRWLGCHRIMSSEWHPIH